jgi:phage FluMu protein Com
MVEIRCKKCNRLLMKAWWIKIEIKCPKCGYVNYIILQEEDGKKVIGYGVTE